MRRVFRVLLAISLVFFPEVAARACSCFLESLSPCHMLEIHEAMFVGDVLTVREARSQTASNLPSHPMRIFRFRVIESFTANAHKGDELEVQTGIGGGDCGYQFELGQRYLVDAYASDVDENVRLSTGICSGTGLESQTSIAISELRTRASGGRVPDLNGQVVTIEGIAQPQSGESKPLANIAVTVTAQSDGRTSRTVTDPSGIYTFPSLRPGTYRIDFDLPPRRAPFQFNGDLPATVIIPDSAGASANCHVSLAAAPSGSISGQIVDPSSVGVAGFVAAYPVTQSNRLPWAAAGSTDPQGHFTLRFLHDGDYRIEFSRGMAGKDVSSNVTVHDGKDTTGVLLTLPVH